MSRSPRILAVHRVLTSRYVQITFGVSAVTLGVWAVVSRGDEIRAAITQVSPLSLTAAWLCVLTGMLVSLVVWRALLAELGSPLPWVPAGRVLFVSQLGKYLPGSVWPMLAQMELGRTHGVPRARSAAAFALSMGLSILTGLVVAGLLLPWGLTDVLLPSPRIDLVAPLLLLLLVSVVLSLVLTRVVRWSGHSARLRRLTWRTSLLVVGTLMLQWLLFGLHLVIIGADLGVATRELWGPATGGFALAWVLGPLLVVSPAGLGLREVTLVAVLAAPLGGSGALLVALLSRLLMTLSDVALAGLSILAAGRLSSS